MNFLYELLLQYFQEGKYKTLYRLYVKIRIKFLFVSENA
jgi:hypothetical protein